ncbi:MFS transporter [Sporomusa acidovorans]|uniref:Sulfoacetate transporter SauU n=1 Tax=Sporomusa acidovorans (strain ATCC 49682 / DSM 3132 / Mol) TaxID=1123286 RepID=A0ABZ3J0E6_SPOA4|nr:MFS transporter [Sporomusa acidovorans]OZC21371.1 putative sulfoacetate transporter SauU [Sporomusa acidovorans DSM 3132]SDE56048.1 Sugar phosphate permease [Sporomusa acidovorans]
MNASFGNKRWMIIIMLTLCYTILYMDRSCMSMSGPAMMKHFNWSATEFGLVSTAFFIGYACTQIPGGWLADRFGGGKVTMIGALWWSLFVFLTPFGSTLGLMVVIRIAMGWGEGVSLPAMTSIIAQWMPKKESGLAQGLSLMGVALGIAAAMPLSAWIIKNWGWQTVFYSFAFIAPVWVVIWWKYGKDKPEQYPTITKEEIAYIRSDQGRPTESAEAVPLTSKDIFSTPSVWTGAISFFCTNYLFYLFMTWLPAYFVRGRGFEMGTSAIYTMMPYIVATFTYPIGGWLADRAAEKFGHNMGRKLFPLLGMVGAGILLVFGSQATSATSAVALISASNGVLCLTMGGYYSMPIVFSPTNAGKIVGLYATCATIGGITAPLLTGIVVDAYGYNYALYLGAGLSILGALILLTSQVKPIVPKANRLNSMKA